MTFDTIPIPHFNFADVPESEAENIFNIYFQSSFNITYMVDNAKDYIKSEIYNQESRADRIIILSFLIIKLTDKFYNLDKPTSDYARGVQEREAKPTYKIMLHWLYRMIENEDIEIPTDLFSENEHNKTAQVLFDISSYLEGQKVVYPEKTELISEAQSKVKEAKKFFWLGKEKVGELLLAALFKIGLDKGLGPVISHILKLIGGVFKNLIEK